MKKVCSILLVLLCTLAVAMPPALAAGDAGTPAFHIDFAPAGAAGLLDVAISGLPEDVSSVACTVWCAEADTREYAAVQDGEGVWRLSVSSADHSFRTGEYRLVAWTETEAGSRRVLGTARTELQLGDGLLLTEPCGEQILLRLTAADLPAGSPVWFRVSPAGSPEVFTVYFGAAQPDGSYTGTMIPSRHGLAGLYTATAFSGHSPVAQTQVEIAGCSSASVAAKTLDPVSGVFRISAEAQAPSGLHSLKAAVWAAADQSDLVWHDMQETDGIWSVDVSPAAHGYRAGTYTIHVYADLANGVRALAAGAVHECVPERQVFAECPAEGGCVITMLGTGLAPGALVSLPTWSEENGQDDIFWYSAQVDAEGAVRCRVDPTLHSAASPLFCTHFYSGGELLGGASYEVHGVKPVSPVQLELGRARRAVYDEVGYDLRQVYLWTVENITYVPRPWQEEVPPGYASREERFALEGLTTHRGDCFVYSAVFAELARGLGYDAEYIEGYVWSVRGLWADHGFVVVHLDGGDYICDPELQSVSTKPRDLFMQPSDRAHAKYKY